MPKKFIFDAKERFQLFIDHIKEKFPNYEDADKKLRFMSADEKQATFLEIMNKYGEKGWEINPVPLQELGGNKVFYYMKKEGYTTKKEAEEE